MLPDSPDIDALIGAFQKARDVSARKQRNKRKALPTEKPPNRLAAPQALNWRRAPERASEWSRALLCAADHYNVPLAFVEDVRTGARFSVPRGVIYAQGRSAAAAHRIIGNQLQACCITIGRALRALRDRAAPHDPSAEAEAGWRFFRRRVLRRWMKKQARLSEDGRLPLRLLRQPTRLLEHCAAKNDRQALRARRVNRRST